MLRIAGLSRTRYHVWSNETPCNLNDRPSCPRSSPQQLTLTEVETIRDMVTSDEYRHVPTGTLARLAQRLGKVFASPSTWRRLVRVHQWRRPRQRVHPAKPKVGIRAARANEIWHVDATLIRLLDGSRAYLHAVIDNYSRRILAWRVAESFDPEATAQILLEATRNMTSSAVPTALVDGGVENFNSAVDKLVQTGLLKRVLAQTEIQFSNSMIESWWRVLKHQWLYLNSVGPCRDRPEAGRVLRRTAQPAPSALSVSGPDSRRDVLWHGGRRSETARNGKDRGEAIASGGQSSPELPELQRAGFS